MLAPTPPKRLVDAQGRPYFLWDVELTLDEFVRRLAAAKGEKRAYLLAKLLRQAKPDDALSLVPLDEIAREWPSIHDRLGKERDFWAWLLTRKGFDVRTDR